MNNRHHALAALQELLKDLFDPSELRNWLGHGVPRELMDELPGDSVSHRRLTRVAVELLDRHGLIEDTFFERLFAEREHRREEIEQVRQLCAQFGRVKRATAHPVGITEPWRMVLRVSWYILAGSAALTLAHLFSGTDISRLLLSAEKQVFSFLPLAYQRSAYLLLLMFSLSTIITFWFLGKRAATNGRG